MIKHQFSDRSRFIIKATMKSRYEEGLRQLQKETDGGRTLQNYTLRHLTKKQQERLLNPQLVKCKKLIGRIEYEKELEELLQ